MIILWYLFIWLTLEFIWTGFFLRKDTVPYAHPVDPIWILGIFAMPIVAGITTVVLGNLLG